MLKQKKLWWWRTHLIDSDTSSEDETNEGATVLAATDDLAYVSLPTAPHHACEIERSPDYVISRWKAMSIQRRTTEYQLYSQPVNCLRRRGDDEVDRNLQMRKIWLGWNISWGLRHRWEIGYMSTFGMWLMKLAFKLTLPMDITDGSIPYKFP